MTTMQAQRQIRGRPGAVPAAGPGTVPVSAVGGAR